MLCKVLTESAHSEQTGLQGGTHGTAKTTPKHGASGETMMLYSSGLKCIFIFYIQSRECHRHQSGQ